MSTYYIGAEYNFGIARPPSKVKVSYLTWVVNESSKAYFQSSQRQVYIPPQHLD